MTPRMPHFPRMNRLVHTLLLFVFLLFQAGTLVSVLRECCPEETAAECATDHCGEDCADCTCALDRTVLTLPIVSLAPPAAPARAFAPHRESTPPEPHAGDILHVPKPALA